MAVTITNVVNRPDFAVLTVAFSADGDTTATITNGTHFNFRDTSGAVAAPVAVLITPVGAVTAAASIVAATSIAAASVVLTKHAGAGSANVSDVRVTMWGTKSKGVA